MITNESAVTPYCLGLAWRGQYVEARRLPDQARVDPHSFFEGWFFQGCGMVYATNREVLDDAASLLNGLGVRTRVDPYVNIDCRFKMSVDMEAYVLMQGGSYQI